MDKDKTFDETKNGKTVSVIYNEGDNVEIADGYDENGTRYIFTDYQSSEYLNYQINKSTKEKLLKHIGKLSYYCIFYCSCNGTGISKRKEIEHKFVVNCKLFLFYSIQKVSIFY